MHMVAERGKSREAQGVAIRSPSPESTALQQSAPVHAPCNGRRRAPLVVPETHLDKLERMKSLDCKAPASPTLGLAPGHPHGAHPLQWMTHGTHAADSLFCRAGGRRRSAACTYSPDSGRRWCLGGLDLIQPVLGGGELVVDALDSALDPLNGCLRLFQLVVDILVAERLHDVLHEVLHQLRERGHGDWDVVHRVDVVGQWRGLVVLVLDDVVVLVLKEVSRLRYVDFLPVCCWRSSLTWHVLHGTGGWCGPSRPWGGSGRRS